MKYEVIDIKANKVEDINLKDTVFKIEPNLSVISQYVRVFLFNQRQGTSSTKTRAEVSGGGRKPWKQKGTGRARQGSTRSPIWAHGGVAHGPKPKDWRLSMPKKMKSLAMKSVLSQRFNNKDVLILDNLKTKEISTKSISEILRNLKVLDGCLVVWNQKDEKFSKSCANIPTLKMTFAGNVNPYEILSAKKVIFMKDSIKTIEERFKDENK